MVRWLWNFKTKVSLHQELPDEISQVCSFKGEFPITWAILDRTV